MVLDTGIRELTSAEMAAHRNCVHSEARERISEVGGVLRVSLNNLAVGSLREYIALSRHQLELSEYINIHTGGSDDPDDLWVDKIHWPDGNYYPYQVARRPVDEHEKVLPPIWAVEQLRDVMWRVKAVGSVLGRSGKHLVATDADGITELSNHQCEIADFLKTGKFKKVPRRRKARYLGGDGTQSAETAQRVRELGEALKEYQGRIEIKTVREFISLSKHQCELAGMVIASEREMKRTQSIEVVHYSDAYETARQKTNGGNPPLSPLKLRGDEGGLWAVDVHPEQLERGNDHASGVAGGNECVEGCPVGKRPQERATGEEERFVMSEPEGRVENRPSPARTRGESDSPGVPFCDTFGHAKVSEKTPQYEAVPLDPDAPCDLMRMPFYPDGTIPLPADGRWVRVDTPDGPVAMRMLNPYMPPPEKEYYIEDDVWEDDYWDEEWDDP